MEEQGSKNRLLTWAVVVVSLSGILYFGYQAISDNTRNSKENPFAYDIEEFKQSGQDRIEYREIVAIDIPLAQLSGLAIGQDDMLYVSGGSSILVFDSTHSIVSRIAAAGRVSCLAVDGDGQIFAGLSDHVEVYHPDDEVWTTWESLGEKAILTSIALTREHIFVADAGNHIVWRFDSAGSKVMRIGDKDMSKDIPGFVVPSPFFDVGIDPDGFLWVANTGRHSLENYTLEGDFRSSWGEFSMEIQGFCGCCNPTHFAILEDGSFVTSEKGLVRVKIYDRLGRLAGVVAGPDQFQEGTVGLDVAVDAQQRIHVLDPARNSVRVFERSME
jgi:hypothetical protein